MERSDGSRPAPIDRPLISLLTGAEALTLASMLRDRLPGWRVRVLGCCVVLRNPHGRCRKTVGSAAHKRDGWLPELATSVASSVRFR